MPVLTVGDPAPWFSPTTTSPTTTSSSTQASAQDFRMGGYRAVLFFFGSSRDPQVRSALQNFWAAKSQFELLDIHFFGITIDPNDRALEQEVPPSAHFHWLWDFTGEISMRYGLCELGERGKGITYDPTTFVLSENLRVLGLFPLETQVAHAEQVLNFLQALPRPTPPCRITQQAPVLLIPDVFQPEFCQLLVKNYETNGGWLTDTKYRMRDKSQYSEDYHITRRRYGKYPSAL